MTLTDTHHFPLEELYLCPECGRAGNRAESCPACANEHGLINLAVVLNREEVDLWTRFIQGD